MAGAGDDLAVQDALGQRALPVGAEVVKRDQGPADVGHRDRAFTCDHQLDFARTDGTDLVGGFADLR